MRSKSLAFLEARCGRSLGRHIHPERFTARIGVSAFRIRRSPRRRYIAVVRRLGDRSRRAAYLGLTHICRGIRPTGCWFRGSCRRRPGSMLSYWRMYWRIREAPSSVVGFPATQQHRAVPGIIDRDLQLFQNLGAECGLESDDWAMKGPC